MNEVKFSWIMFVELGTLFADYAIMFLFFKDFLGQQNSNKNKNILFAFLFIIVTIINTLFLGHIVGMKLIVSICLYIAIAFLLFDGDWKWKLFAGFLFFAFMILAEVITMYGLMWAAHVTAKVVVDRGTLAVYGFIISKVLLLLISKVVGYLRSKENKRLSFEYWMAIVTFPIISTIILYVIYDFGYQLEGAEFTAPIAFAVLGILFVNIFAFRLIEFFADKAEREMRNLVLTQNFDKQVKECERLEYIISSKAKFFHDIKHFKPTLNELVKDRKFDEAQELLDKVLELEAVQTKEYVETSNNVLNALFNYYIAYAEQRGIRVDVGDVYFPKGLKIDIADLCSIFGNSLENAVEACMRMNEGPKFITIGLRYRDNELVYKITNSTDGNLKKGKRWFTSSKQTAGIHGLGIEIMENAVKKYGGTFGAKHMDNNVFVVGFSIDIS